MADSPQRKARRAWHMRTYRELDRDGVAVVAKWIHQVQAQHGDNLPPFPRVQLPVPFRKISKGDSDG